MWLFAAVCLALAVPAFRAALESLFAELTILFFNYISVVAIVTTAVFIGALVLPVKTLKSKLQSHSSTTLQEATSVTQKQMKSSSFSTGNALVKALFFASTMLPLSVAATSSTLTTTRHLQTSTAVPFTLADDPTALAAIRANLTMCKYSGVRECISNPTSVPEFGVYRKQPGYCAAFDSAYVNITSISAAIPNRYLPTSVEDGYASGFHNKFSEWSTDNQAQFQVDCPILYNNTIAKGDEYFCCTESQYEGLKTQVRQIPGLCTTCKQNLRNVFCQMTCSPNNSMFLEIDEVRIMPGDDAHPTAVFPAIEELTYWVGLDWIRDIYDYCLKDSSFSLLCNPTQNCTDGYGLMSFMGAYKFNTIGSPLQINVKTMNQVSTTEQKEMFCACDDTNATGCFSPMDTHLLSCVGVCGSLCAVSASEVRTYHPACYSNSTTLVASDESSIGSSSSAVVSKWEPLMTYLADNLIETDFSALNYFLVIVGCVVALFLIGCFLYISHRTRKYASVRRSEHTPGAIAVVTSTSDERRLSFMDEFVSVQLKRWSMWVSKGNNPLKVSGIVMFFVIACTLGLVRLDVETDPVKLWVSTSSLSYRERDHYGELFMPFYRSQQMIMVPKDGGDINRVVYLKEAIRLQEMVAAVTYGPADASYPERIELTDICWRVTGTTCTVQSITQYFQNRMDHFEFYEKYNLVLEHFSQCMYSPTTSDVSTCSTLANSLKDGDSIPTSMSDCPCLASFGSPMNLYNTYLGGFPNGAPKNTTLYLQSRALVSTALVYNFYDTSRNEPAKRWEREYIKMLKVESEENELFDIYFTAETSVQDEVEVESSGDMMPVVLCYLVMIVYVSLGINRWSLRKDFFQTSKITVGFLGIVCIMFAVSSTIGFFMWFGVKLQLVIMEVVPFLSVAIGVDNIFLIVNAISRKQEELKRAQPDLFVGLEHDVPAARDVTSQVVAEGLAYIGPSIFMASVTESVAFAFGCISPMPVVLWFAAFSCIAVLANFTLQMTLFVSIVTLDKRRELSGKYDILCWKRASGPMWTQPDMQDAPEQQQPTTPADTKDEATSLTSTSMSPKFLDRCIDAYASFLSLRIVKLLVMLLFWAWTIVSIYSIENINHGLPQAESMPSKSYMVKYFNALDKYLATGAPVYFVVEGGYKRNPAVFDLEDTNVQSLLCKSKEFCGEFAIPKIIDALANEGNRNITHLSEGTTYSWMDDFWGFVNPDSECCRVDSHNAYLPILTDNATYTVARPSNPTCLPVQSTVPPVPHDYYMSLFSMFSTASAGNLCSYGGGSIYRGQFSIDKKPIPIITSSTPQVVLSSTGYGNQISAFTYMIVSTGNPTQKDFIDGYKQARRAAKWISEKTGIDVWAFSLTYVYFDQYLTVVHDTYKLVGLALAAIFVVQAVYYGGILYPLIVALSSTNLVILVMGLMEPNDILLNGLSMVNLIIAAGFGVEFCGHYVRMFAKAKGSGDERARIALRKVLGSVLFGITITKILGLSMLTLADSRIFKKYYFRMYMMVVLCGMFTGMLLLPVVLSLSADLKQFFLGSHQRGAKTPVDPSKAAESPAFQSVESAKENTRMSPSSGTRHSNSD
uniref:SSD domain-containing protein n=1 Tax=Globisporangium ultimum (strain ATCC 200006 / CBS 805.95 / DAOM BR144) TaxID=431595 RepID=K3WBN3_GLOUD